MASFAVIDPARRTFLDEMLPTGDQTIIWARNPRDMVEQLQRHLGSDGRIDRLDVWAEGGTDVPGIAIGGHWIHDMPGVSTLRSSMRELEPLRSRFAADGMVVLHNCNAGGLGLPIAREIAQTLHVDVAAPTGSTLGPPLAFVAFGDVVLIGADGVVHRDDDPGGLPREVPPVTPVLRWVYEALGSGPSGDEVVQGRVADLPDGGGGGLDATAPSDVPVAPRAPDGHGLGPWSGPGTAEPGTEGGHDHHGHEGGHDHGAGPWSGPGGQQPSGGDGHTSTPSDANYSDGEGHAVHVDADGHEVVQEPVVPPPASGV